MPEEPMILVVGAGGLLGSAVVRQTGGRGVAVAGVPWGEPGAGDVVKGQVERFAGDVESGSVVWCAGAGVIGSKRADLDYETSVFAGVLESLRMRPDLPVFLASSAGGVHGGATRPQISEFDDACPISDYGANKLQQEVLLREWCAESGGRGVVGRIATLYGPGQSLDKSQGLISTLCRSGVTRRPVSVYVPLDTLRDFVYVDDAAAVVLGCVRRAGDVEAGYMEEGSVVTKIISSARSCSIGAVLGETRRICPRPPLVVLGSSPHRSSHGDALVFRSRVWNDLDRLCRTPLSTGIAATYRSIEVQVARGDV